MRQGTVSDNRRTAALFLLLAISATSGRAGENQWTPLGPKFGFVQAIAFEPGNSRTIYQQVADPANAQPGRLLKSTDGGATFSVIKERCSGTPYHGPVLKVDPRDPRVIYVVCDNFGVRTLYRSSDRGAQWRALLPSETMEVQGMTDLAIDGSDPQILYVATRTSLLVSHNGGDDWTTVATGSFAKLVAHQARGFLVAFDAEGHSLRTEDGGATWTAVNLPPPPFPVFVSYYEVPTVLAVDPRDHNFLLGSLAAHYDFPSLIVRSSNGGRSWEPVILGGPAPSGDHPWAYAIAYDPNTPGTIYAGGSGVYRSTNWGTSWTTLNEGLEPHQIPPGPPFIDVLSLVVDPNNTRHLLAGTRDQLYEITLSGPLDVPSTSGMYRGILNAASFANPNAENGGIARGSVFSVFDPSLSELPDQISQYPLPTTLGDGQQSMKVTVGAVSVDALMLYIGYTGVGSGQANAILPSNIPAGDGTLTVFQGHIPIASLPIRVADRLFGIFTRDQSGRGAGVIQNIGMDGHVSDNSGLNPARPGQVAILWGTGLGPVSGDEAAGPLPGNLLWPDPGNDVALLPSDPTEVGVLIWVGGQEASILYGGRSGCCAGVDQISFILPAGVEGCNVPVVVQIGNIFSNYVTMAIRADGAACPSSP